MTKQITLTYFSDPGHGWVRIPKARLVKLGIAEKISPFSYQRGTNAFVEEDGDLSTLVDALKAQGYEVKFKGNSSNRTSKIRNYNSYTVNG